MITKRQIPVVIGGVIKYIEIQYRLFGLLIYSNTVCNLKALETKVGAEFITL